MRIEGSAVRSLLEVALLTATLATAVPAQEPDAGSAWGMVVGGVLGLYSGAVLGSVGALVPCSQTYASIRCVRTGAGAAAAVGMIGGIALGDADADAVWSASEGAGLGALIGSAAILGLKPFFRRWNWGDVAAGGVVGGAVGASGAGAGIGLAAGSVLGVALWRLVPAVELPDALSVALFGLAAGGMVHWVVRAADARERADAAASPAILQFRLPVR